MYSESSVQILQVSMITTSVSVSTYKPCLIDSVGRFLLVSLTPQETTILFPPLLWNNLIEFGVGVGWYGNLMQWNVPRTYEVDFGEES